MSVAQEFVDASRYIISDHKTFDLTSFAAAKDDDGVTFTAEPDSLHCRSRLWSAFFNCRKGYGGGHTVSRHG